MIAIDLWGYANGYRVGKNNDAMLCATKSDAEPSILSVVLPFRSLSPELAPSLPANERAASGCLHLLAFFSFHATGLVRF